MAAIKIPEGAEISEYLGEKCQELFPGFDKETQKKATRWVIYQLLLIIMSETTTDSLKSEAWEYLSELINDLRSEDWND